MKTIHKQKRMIPQHLQLH